MAGAAATVAAAGSGSGAMAKKKKSAAEWRNWSGSVVCNPKSVEMPNSSGDVASLIARARKEKARVRVAGSGHSFSPVCETKDYLVSLDEMQGVIDADTANHRARVHAGTKLYTLGEPLFEAGMALENQGDVDRQSLGGVIGTGTHGTGLTLRNISNQAVGLKLIVGTGDVIECSETENAEIFKAALVAFGSLGIITEATVQCVPAYKLHEKNWAVPFEDGMTQLDDMIAGHRHFEFFYTKNNDSCIMKTLSETDAEPAKDFAEGERIGWSYEVFPSPRNTKFNEMEFAVPFDNGPSCLREIRDVIMAHDEVGWPIEYRTVKGDDVFLSPHYGRDSVAISVHQSYRREHESFFRDCQAAFLNHGGRPHWGKMQYLGHEALAKLYPQWGRFQKVRDEVDPDRVFENPYLKQVLG